MTTSSFARCHAGCDVGGRSGRGDHKGSAALLQAAEPRRIVPDCVSDCYAPLRADEVVVRVGSAVAEELPRLADLGNLVEVDVPDEQLLVVRGA